MLQPQPEHCHHFLLFHTPNVALAPNQDYSHQSIAGEELRTNNTRSQALCRACVNANILVFVLANVCCAWGKTKSSFPTCSLLNYIQLLCSIESCMENFSRIWKDILKQTETNELKATIDGLFEKL